MVSIYCKNPEQVTKNSLLTFVGVVSRDSSELAALTLDALSQVNLPVGDVVYSDFI